MSLIYIEPIFAHCTRKLDLASTLPPLSTSNEKPVLVGITGARGGRSTPGILPIIVWPPTIIAPELPADINASAWPSFTRYIALTNEESFFRLTAITGGSPVSIISVALITSTRFLSYVYLLSSSLMLSSLPTR